MIGISRVGDVTTIELQRPERRNALNSELVDTLREAVEKAAADDVRAQLVHALQPGSASAGGLRRLQRYRRLGLPPG